MASLQYDTPFIYNRRKIVYVKALDFSSLHLFIGLAFHPRDIAINPETGQSLVHPYHSRLM
jgi:hypothetical protein